MSDYNNTAFLVCQDGQRSLLLSGGTSNSTSWEYCYVYQLGQLRVYYLGLLIVNNPGILLINYLGLLLVHYLGLLLFILNVLLRSIQR